MGAMGGVDVCGGISGGVEGVVRWAGEGGNAGEAKLTRDNRRRIRIETAHRYKIHKHSDYPPNPCIPSVDGRFPVDIEALKIPTCIILNNVLNNLRTSENT